MLFESNPNCESDEKPSTTWVRVGTIFFTTTGPIEVSGSVLESSRHPGCDAMTAIVLDQGTAIVL